MAVLNNYRKTNREDGNKKSSPDSSTGLLKDNAIPTSSHYLTSKCIPLHSRLKHVCEIAGPVIMDFSSNKHLTEGESITFKTAVSGNPEPTLIWYHEGIELKSDYAVEIQPSGVLSIASAELKHSGVYKLQARNPSGTAEREVKLIVRPDNEEINPVQKEIVEFVPIPVNSFGEYVAGNHSHSDAGFRNQYEVITYVTELL